MLPKRLRVTVTADDIANGIRRSKYLCPLANALHRMYPDLAVSVCWTEIAVGIADYTMSKRSQTFVHMYDGYHNVKPATFILVKRWSYN